MSNSIGIFLTISYILIAMPIGNHATDCQGKEKVAKIRVYAQDRFSGENQTVYQVASSSITPTSPTQFGRVNIVDSPLTTTPDINSEVIGRAQGQVIYSDLATPSLAMSFNIVFTSGEYNGSTISMVGRFQIAINEVRELSIVGGTGVFRFAQGYTLLRLVEFNSTRGLQECTFYVTYVANSN